MDEMSLSSAESGIIPEDVREPEHAPRRTMSDARALTEAAPRPGAATRADGAGQLLALIRSGRAATVSEMAAGVGSNA
jgi:hypothetical protein